MRLRILLLALAAACPGAAENPSEILAAAANKGRQVMEALRNFTYYAELSVETVSAADVITGRYYRFSRIYYDADGLRRETLFEEKSSLPEDAHIGANAAHNLMRVYQFFITPEALSQYEFNYVGRELVDEINTYVFDVKPKVKLPDPDKSPERYLKGRVWIDDQDLQVVKVAGQALPEQSDHRTPRFETYFQNYDGYWFPAYTYADDTIWVGRRRSRVIIKVKFTGYKKTAGR